MGNYEAYYIKEMIFTNSYLGVGVFAILLTLTLLLRKYLRQENKHTELEQLNEELTQQLLHTKEQLEQERLMAKQEENLFLTPYMVTQQEIISKLPVGAEDIRVLKKIRTDIEEHLLKMKQEQQQRAFIEAYKYEPLYVALSCFCYAYDHCWLCLMLNFNLSNRAFRLDTVRQGALLRLLFLLVAESSKYSSRIEITISRDRKNILLDYIDAGTEKVHLNYSDLISPFKHILTQEAFIVKPGGICLFIPEKAG